MDPSEGNGMSAEASAQNNPTQQPSQSSEMVSKRDQETAHDKVAGATGLLALGNIFSRVLGLVREQLLAFLFGASAPLDAFQVAVLVPKNFYDLLIGGHVNGAIVPVLSEIVTLEGRDAMWRVVSILVTLLTLFISALVLLIELFAPQFVQLAADGYDAETILLATQLLRITAPALLFLGLFAVLSGTLYALNIFSWPALAGAVFNGTIVVVTLLLVPPLEWQLVPQQSLMQPLTLGRPPDAAQAAAFGWLFGAIVQMALQMPGLRGSKLRISLDWRHPALKRIGTLYIPVMASLILDIVVIRFFSYKLASRTGIEGGIYIMNLATTLLQFPQGLVATAISLAILPTLAAQAAQIADQGITAFRDTLGLGLRLATTLIIPATVGLFMLATPIIVLLFERGQFDATDTALTAIALRLYLIGLPFAALDLLLVYAFYARKDTLTPAIIGVFSHIVYIIAVLLLFERFGLFSLMIADSIKHITHATVSGVLLWRRLSGFGSQRLLSTLVKTSLAAGLMSAIIALIVPQLQNMLGTDGLLAQLLLVVSVSSLGSAAYLGAALVLGIEELRWIGRLLRRRLFC